MSKRVLESSDSSSEDDSFISNKRSLIGWSSSSYSISDDDLVDLLLEDINYLDQIEEPEVVTPKEKTQTPPLFTLPRILKRDLRKKLPVMLNNVMNSHDFHLVKSFFSTFCRGDGCQLQQSCVFNMNTSTFEINTIDQIIYYTGGILEAMPDSIFRMSNFQLKRRSDTEGTEITAYITCTGTAIYPITPPDIAYFILDSDVNNRAKHLLANYDIDNPPSIHTCGLPRLDTPIEKSVHITVTLHVDEEKRIQRIGQTAHVTAHLPDLFTSA